MPGIQKFEFVVNAQFVDAHSFHNLLFIFLPRVISRFAALTGKTFKSF